jgi:hypothetical protein
VGPRHFLFGGTQRGDAIQPPQIAGIQESADSTRFALILHIEQF